MEYGLSGLYDVIVLDVMLPKKDGFAVTSELRRAHVDTPILLLTARDAISDKIVGYDSGADDYMTKPFSPMELMAHLRALTRRRGDVLFEHLEVGDLTLDLERHALMRATKSISLSFKEFLVCKILMANAEHLVSKETLIAKAWGIDSSAGYNNVEAYISFLRKKLRRKFIALNMAVVAMVLSLAFASICYLAYSQDLVGVNGIMNDTLNRMVSAKLLMQDNYGGSVSPEGFPPMPPYDEGGQAPADDASADEEALRSPEIGGRTSTRAQLTPLVACAVDARGSLELLPLFSTALISDEYLDQAVSEALSAETTFGGIDSLGLLYGKRTEGATTFLTFVDASSVAG